MGCDGSGTPNSGCTEEIPIPEKTATRTVRKVSAPATTTEEVIPAQYATITKRVIKTPATTREEVIPAEYQTITKNVVKSPARVEEIPIPAEYATRTVRKVNAPASFQEEVIPAQYETITKRQLKTPASTRTIEVPAEYTTITKRVLVEKGGFTEWREVLCGQKVDTATVREIQDALRSRGYDPGPTDNILGSRTKAALTKFQKDNGLPVGNLNMETLRALGLNY
jgi:hypothetical protein